MTRLLKWGIIYLTPLDTGEGVKYHVPQVETGRRVEMRKCIEKRASKNGAVFALIDNGNSTFGVLELCENYDGQVRGGIRKTWRYVKAAVLNEQQAREIFIRRTQQT